MEIRSLILTENDFRDIAQTVGVKIFSDWNRSGITKTGNRYRLRLAVGDILHSPSPEHKTQSRKFQKISKWSGKDRRTASVCYHGHYAFMREVFRRDNEARIRTSWAKYYYNRMDRSRRSHHNSMSRQHEQGIPLIRYS